MLPSGLRVETETVEGSHTFSVGFFVGVGSRHESEHLHGASHFLEHVLFKGTKRRNAEEISAAIEEVGGDINAYTAREHTCFYARVLAEDAELAVDVLTDMLINSVILAEDVEAERAVILDEIAMHSSDPGEVAYEKAVGNLLGSHPLGRPVIGSAVSITAMSRAQIAGFWRRHYHPEHMVVAASGRVDHDRLVAALADFSRCGEPAKGASHKVNCAVSDSALSWETRALEHCTVVAVWPSPPIFDERRYALGLLMMALGGGMSSRLFVEIRERRGLTYAIDASEGAWSDAGMLSVDWGCMPNRVGEIAGLVREILRGVIDEGLTERELTRAKGQMRGQTVLAYESPGARMSRLGSSAVAGDARSVEEQLDRYDAVTGADIHAVAREFLDAAPVMSVVGPRTDRRRTVRVLEKWAQA